MDTQVKDEITEQVEEGKNKVVPIRSLSAVGGGGSGPWLATLNVGCRFLCRKKTEEKDMIYECWILEKTRLSYRISMELVSGQEVVVWKEPFSFCEKYQLQEILEE